MMKISGLALMLCSGALLIAACGDSSSNSGTRDAVAGDSSIYGDGTVGTLDGGTSTSGDGNLNLSDQGSLTDAPWTSTNQPECNGTVYACSDGIDNDGDGLIDARDPECVGPCDDDEGSFATGIPGDNVDACKQDCFFDGNSGGGDDKCDWNLGCDTAYTEWAAANDGKVCQPSKCDIGSSTQCIGSCLRLTPNGCDCYGCCTVYIDGSPTNIYLGSPDCSTEHPENCAACTPRDDCVNTCGECELCLGKTLEDLPPSCFPATPDGGTATTDGGVTPPSTTLCGPGVVACPNLTHDECPTGEYCQTGCCIQVVLY